MTYEMITNSNNVVVERRRHTGVALADGLGGEKEGVGHV